MHILRLFGPPDVRDAAGQRAHAVLAQSKHLALLALLASARHDGMRRDRLIGLLWPDLDDARARNALSKAAHNIRRSLGEDALAGRFAEDLSLAGACWQCDRWDFQDAVARGAHADALAIYQRGMLLEGVYVPDASAFEHWVEAERLRLRDRASGCATALADAAEREGDLRRASDHLATAAEIAPLDEALLRRRIELLDRAGNRAAALATYADFCVRLDRDLQTRPSAESVALIDRIRARNGRLSSSGSGPATPMSAGDAAAPAAPEASPVDPPSPFVAPADQSPLPLKTRDGSAVRTPLRRAGLIALGLFAAALSLWLWVRRPTPAPLPTVVVMPLINQTGDSALTPIGEMAADRLSRALMRHRLADVLDTRSRVQMGLSSAVLPPDTDPEQAAALARQTGAAIVIVGRFQRSGNAIRMFVTMRGVPGREGPLTVADETGPRSDPVAVLTRVEERVLGVFAALRDVRLPTASTFASRPPTLSAYTAYTAGLGPWGEGDYRTAAKYFALALQLDSTFVTAIPWLYDSWRSIGRAAQAESLVTAYASRLVELDAYDRAFLEWVKGFQQGNREAMYDAALRMRALAPSSPDALFCLGFAAVTTNRFTRAVEAFEALDRRPGWPQQKLFSALMWQFTAYHLAGRYDEARAYVAKVRGRFPYEREVCRYELSAMAPGASLEALTQAMTACAATTGGADSAWLAGTRLITARELRAHGREQEAVAFVAPMVDWQRRAYEADTASATVREDYAALLAATRRWTEALPYFVRLERAQAGDNARPRFASAVAIAAVHVGDTTLALDMLEKLRRNRLAPQVLLQRARVLAQLGRRDEAVAELRDAIARGISAAEVFHRMPDIEPLYGYPPYEVLVRERP